MVLACGHTFCEGCLLRIDNPLCPLCRKKMSLSEAHHNLLISQLIKEQQVYCKYRNLGCPSVVALQNKRDHEHHCKYSLSYCKWLHKGCKFQGTKEQVETHLSIPSSICPFEIMKDVVSYYDDQLKSLRVQLQSQQEELSILKENLKNPNLILSSPSTIVTTSTTTSTNADNNNSKYEEPSSHVKWNMNLLQCSHTLNGHNRGVTALAFSTKLKYLFSGSHDTMIKVWDCNQLDTTNNISPICFQTLQGHK